MMFQIALVAEVLATILCIHCIYGKKVTFDAKTVGAILGILSILEVANSCRMGGILSFSIYVILFIYCKSKFRSSIMETLISLILCIIVATSMQFMCFSFVSIVLPCGIYTRNAIGNILILAVFCITFSACNLHRLQEILCKKSKYVMLLSGFMCLIVMMMLLQGKAFYRVQMKYFVLVIPAIILLLYSILKWFTAQNEAERMEKEVQKAEENVKSYENLLTKVRLCQHELKNHIAAIFSAHYTYKTYEKLVQAQEEYCKKILDENKYNSLLLLGDKILAGYLYGKFQEAEDDGIEIDYKVAAKIEKTQVPTYYLIEMLGILFDNAVEALKNTHKKVISFETCESQNEYEFSIRNPFPYVSYDEITEWFKLDKSEKGSGRGIGLYHLKCLCEEWHCDLECRNVEIEQDNWIAFVLKVKKADNA